MRRPVIVSALVAACVAAGAAIAAGQTPPGYALQAATSPRSPAGTAGHPIPLGITLAATDAPQNGQRPPTLAGFDFVLRGTRFNGGAFFACTATQIQQAGNDAGCPHGSRVGSGGVDIISGSSTDPRDRTITCHLSLVVYNGGADQMTLWLTGGPSAPQPCYRNVAQAIPASASTNRAGTTTVSFRFPAPLIHPLDGFDDAVVALAARVPVKVTRVGARTVGYLESVGGCNPFNHRRAFTVRFVQQSSQVVAADARLPCTPPPQKKRKRPTRRPARHRPAHHR